MAFETEKPVVQRTSHDAQVPLKQWTSLDHLTHDFNNSENYRAYCLEKYGQYMGHDSVRKTKN